MSFLHLIGIPCNHLYNSVRPNKYPSKYPMCMWCIAVN